MFAPISTANACGRVIRAVDTKPTSITVIMDDDCTITVETIPEPMPTNLLPAAFDMNFRSPPPAVACRPSERCFMPSRNMPSPPAIVVTIVNASDMLSAIRYIIPYFAVSPLYITCHRMQKKWQSVPARTKMCQTMCA